MCIIAALTGISGSTKIGKNCMIAGQVGFVGHIIIGDNVKIGAQSGVHKNIENNAILQGTPVVPYKRWYRTAAIINKLPEIKRQVDNIEKRLEKNNKE